MVTGPSPNLISVGPAVGPAGQAPGHSKSSGRIILVYATPGCGAEHLMDALSKLRDFTMVSAAGFPIEDAVWITRYFGRPPLPGLHFLADYHAVLKATRRLMDSITDLACKTTGSADCVKIIYSPDNILNIPTLRQLYPDALHLHVVRDVSRAPLRMAAAADLPVLRFCERWRRSERAFLDVPPLPSQATIRYEDLNRAPGETLATFMRLARLPFTNADQDAFARQFSPVGPGAEHVRGQRPLGAGNKIGTTHPVGIREHLAARCAAVYCHAELAALRYRPSPGRPGSLRAFAAVAGLTTLSRTPVSPRWSGVGEAGS